MDFMRDFSVQRMQLSEDPDDWCWVRWVPAVKGARPLPFMHAYGFALWNDREMVEEPPGPQIHFLPSEYRPPAKAQGDGKDFAGLPEWYQNGLPLDVRDRPDVGNVCGGVAWDSVVGISVGFDVRYAAGWAAYGGQAEGGGALFLRSYTLTAAGGQREGGQAVYPPPPYYVVAFGGQRQGGSALFVLPFTYAAAGGQAQGGSALFVPSYTLTAAGGQVQGGTAVQSSGYPLLASGGQVQGGAAQQAGSGTLLAGGGQVQGGTAEQHGSGTLLAGGGQVQGGTAEQDGSGTLLAGGGQVQGGAAEQAGSSPSGGLVASGGQVQGGSAGQSGAGAPSGGLVASGGQVQGGSALQQGDSDVIPTGVVMYTAAGQAGPPAGWLYADGSLVSRATYAALFQAIGVAYGAGDGSTTFQLPDLRGRFVCAPGGPIGAAAQGEIGGATSHAMTKAELATHSHLMVPNADPVRLWDPVSTGGTVALTFPAGARTFIDKAATEPEGGGAPFPIVNPYVALRGIIKT